jgi:hypothetical protein
MDAYYLLRFLDTRTGSSAHGYPIQVAQEVDVSLLTSTQTRTTKKTWQYIDFVSYLVHHLHSLLDEIIPQKQFPFAKKSTKSMDELHPLDIAKNSISQQASKPELMSTIVKVLPFIKQHIYKISQIMQEKVYAFTLHCVDSNSRFSLRPWKMMVSLKPSR